MVITVIGYVLAALVGISLGLIGGGGSILATPILIYVMGVPPQSAIAMSLIIVGAVSLVGILPHWRQGNIDFKTAALFAPAAMVGAYLGARIATLPIVTPTFQLISFAVMMLVASFFMIRKSSRSIQSIPEETLKPSSTKSSDHAGSTKSSDHAGIPRWLAIPSEGLGVGALTGFVGIGGGFMVIPALVLLGGMPMKQAVGTSLVIIALKSVTGFAGYLGRVPVDVPLMVTFTIVANIGMILGAYLTRFIEAKQLEKGFGYFTIAVAIFILIKR
ncbi:sulfite exporter TauE/SafE family protein [Leptothermofonsia sp. ETS-13]|uniref:sulfite exporter TauE/SafE family protein n=1 Tax=Leptothermofonsia sp. ETS-13 TaxID=3035696 RepID=UPI003BA14AB1